MSACIPDVKCMLVFVVPFAITSLTSGYLMIASDSCSGVVDVARMSMSPIVVSFLLMDPAIVACCTFGCLSMYCLNCSACLYAIVYGVLCVLFACSCIAFIISCCVFSPNPLMFAIFPSRALFSSSEIFFILSVL